MTDLRTAAQQALEALDAYSWEQVDAARAALKAALAQEQAEQTWVCPDSPEHCYKKPGHCEDCGKTLVLAQHPGCEHCNHPLYAATKCRVCGRVTEQAEPAATVAETATTQQQIADTPPSDYRRGYWDGFNIGKREGRIEAEDALAEPVLQTCNCRWDGEVQVQQCTLHEAHVDAIKEWAQRAKFAEKKLAALAEPTVKESLQVEPVQEPVAFIHRQGNHWEVSERHLDEDERDRGWTEEPLYTAPPKRKPLTDEEIDRITDQQWAANNHKPLYAAHRAYARAIERAHKIGDNT